jgi:hypothetical protein
MLHTQFHAAYAGIFISTQDVVSNCNGSLVIAIQRKSEYRFQAADIMLSHFENNVVYFPGTLP